VDLLPESLKGEADKVIKGEDTMDVWFDSGSSWSGVLKGTPGLTYPADLYLEGSDQHRCASRTSAPTPLLLSPHGLYDPFDSHTVPAYAVTDTVPCRGWFQSSLLTSVATNGMAPYQAVLTHGFVLDERGAKMSKSLGNVIDPLLVIEGGSNERQEPAYGADVLRLWVASVDYAVDVSIGSNILKQVFESYRKLRGSLRFLLGNVCDFDPAQDRVPLDALPLLDRYMLHRFGQLCAKVNAEYAAYNFGAIYRAVNVFLSVDLSAFYFELGKDRLYIRGTAVFERRACQTVLHIMLRGLLAAMAPITPHMCEDAWQNLIKESPAGAALPRSVFEAGIPVADAAWELPAADLAVVDAALAAKDVAMKALECARGAKIVGSPLDAHVSVHVDHDATRTRLQQMSLTGNGVDELRYLFVTSAVTVVDAAPEGEYVVSDDVAGLGRVTAAVTKAEGTRCERCWNYSLRVGELAVHPRLCERCSPVVVELGFELPAG
jgi:isoleucyl-tRNA synthetase